MQLTGGREEGMEAVEGPAAAALVAVVIVVEQPRYGDM